MVRLRVAGSADRWEKAESQGTGLPSGYTWRLSAASREDIWATRLCHVHTHHTHVLTYMLSHTCTQYFRAVALGR